MNSLEINKKNYRVYTISKQSLFIWTIFLIYLKQKGLNFTQIMLLNSIGAFVTFICEVPTGILADRFSRKKLLIYGEILKCLNLIIILITNNYYYLILNSVLGGIGEAVVSGCGEALIYDSFSENNEEESYKQYLANINMWALRFSAGATLLSSLLYKVNVDLPMILSILIQIVSIFHIFKLVDNKLFENSTFNIKGEFKQQLDNIKGLINNKIIIKLFFMYFVMMIIISNLNYTSQSFLPSIGIDPLYLGIIFFVFNIISSYGAKHSVKVNLKGKYILIVYGILLVGLNFSGMYVSLIILCISRYINGMVWPILNADINNNIKENRATILSYKSLFVQISFIIFDPLIGVSLDCFGIRETYALMGIVVFISLFVSVVSVSILKKYKQRETAI